MTHKYAVGQIVYFQAAFGRAPSGQCEIVRVLPITTGSKVWRKLLSAPSRSMISRLNNFALVATFETAMSAIGP
jgi:hypothetical protein